MVASEEGSNDALKYCLEGSRKNLVDWGHEYLRSIAGEIGQVYTKRVEENVEIVTIMKHAIPARLNHRLEFLGDQWRAEFLEWIQELPMGTKASRCSSVNSVLEKRCHY